MTRHARTLSTPLSAIDPVHKNGCHPETDELVNLFHHSLEAHDLAVLSEKNFSAWALYESGSLQKYKQRASRLADSHSSGDPFAVFLAKDADRSWSGPNSRQSYRSALIRMAAQEIFNFSPRFWLQMIARQETECQMRELIRVMQPHVDKGTHKRLKRVRRPLSSSEIFKLQRAVEFIIQVQPDPDHIMIRNRSMKVIQDNAHSRSHGSKKHALYALNDHQRRLAKKYPGYNWRHHFWNASVMPDPHLDDYRRACIAALMLSGCRPSEFCDDLGVVVTALEHGGRPHLVFKIAGAKCAVDSEATPGKGQEWRLIEIACQTPEATWLFDYVASEANGRIALALDAPTHDRTGTPLSPTERRRRVSGCLGKLVKRLGKVAFPKQRHALTPYVLRHGLASDIRASKYQFGEEEIAAVLGHQSARTQGHYGSPNTSRGLIDKRATQITQAAASTPVRSPGSGPSASPDIGERPSPST